MDLKRSRIAVTGSSGFLGHHVVEELRSRGVTEIFVPRKSDFDLVRREGCERLFREARPEILIHLAAKVGGIGANRENPGTFFYENLMMGAQLLEEARINGIAKFVTIGTVCAYPKFTRLPFREDDLWEGYPERDERALRHRQESAAGAGPGLPPAVRHEHATKTIDV